jgi:hypothetical protein
MDTIPLTVEVVRFPVGLHVQLEIHAWCAAYQRQDDETWHNSDLFVDW